MPSDPISSATIMTICKVGYTAHSKTFSIEFKSASQRGVRSRVLEERTDWRAVMEILLASLESHHSDTAEVCIEYRHCICLDAF